MRKSLHILTIIFFVFPQIASADTTHTAFAINVPEENGTVTQRYKGKSTQTIIHIQDTHSSFEAQENLSAIITYLKRAETSPGLEDVLIGVEGASGPVDLSAFREYPLADVRTRVAKDFVKKGIFTGSELAAIAADADDHISLYGIEDTQLFTENFRAFYEVATKTSELEMEMDALEESLNLLKDITFSAELAEFDHNAIAFENDPSQLMKFLGSLYQHMATCDIDAMDFLTLFQFKEVFMLQASIKKDLLKKELTNLAETLSASFPVEKAEVIHRYEAYTKGTISEQAVGTYLYARAMKYGIVQQKYPMLERSIQYWRKYETVDMAVLLPEIMNAMHAIRLKLARTESERTVVEAQNTLMRLRQLMRLESLKSDVERFREDRAAFSLTAVVEKLQKAKHQSGANITIPDTGTQTDNILDQVDTFYERAEARDKALLTNLLTRMQKENTKTGVLIAGGYHSDGLVRQMRAADISFVTVLPAITTTAQDVPYMDRMLGSIAPLSQSLISHINYSRLNALLSAIARDHELSAVLKDFTAALELETARNIDLSARLYNAAKTNERFAAIAKALWEVSTQVATDADSETIDMQQINTAISRGNYINDFIKQIRALHDPSQQRFSARDTIGRDPTPVIARALQETLADLSPFIRSLIENALSSARTSAEDAVFIDQQIGSTSATAQYEGRLDALEKAQMILTDPTLATSSPKGVRELWDILEELELGARPIIQEDPLPSAHTRPSLEAKTDPWTEAARLRANAYKEIRSRISRMDDATAERDDSLAIPIRFDVHDETLRAAASRIGDGISADGLKRRLRSLVNALIEKARVDSWGLIGDFRAEGGSIVISENAEMYMHQNNGTIYIPFGTLQTDNSYSGITGALEFGELYTEAAIKIFHELWHESDRVDSALEDIIKRHLSDYVDSDGTVSEATREYIEELWLTYRNRVQLFSHKISLTLTDADGNKRYGSLTTTQTGLDRMIADQDMEGLRHVARLMAIEDTSQMSVAERVPMPLTDVQEPLLIHAFVALDFYAEGLSLADTWDTETSATFENNNVDIPALWRTLDLWQDIESPESISILISRGIEENEPVRLALEAMFTNEEFKKRSIDLNIVYEAQDGIDREDVKTQDYALILQMDDEDFGLDNSESTPTAFAFSRERVGTELGVFHSALLLLLAQYIEALRSGLPNINENMYSNIFAFNNGVLSFSEDFAESISTHVIEAVKQHVFNIAA